MGNPYKDTSQINYSAARERQIIQWQTPRLSQQHFPRNHAKPEPYEHGMQSIGITTYLRAF